MSLTEFQLHKQAAEYLRTVLAPEVLWWHTPNNPRDAKHGAILKSMGALAGVPDFMLMWRSGSEYFQLGLELKVEYRKPSDAQLEFADRFRAVGGFYSICRSIDAISDELERYGVPTRGKLAA